VLNIREWAGGRKKGLFKRPELPSKRIRVVFGIPRGGWRISWLRGALWGADLQVLEHHEWEPHREDDRLFVKAVS